MNVKRKRNMFHQKNWISVVVYGLSKQCGSENFCLVHILNVIQVMNLDNSDFEVLVGFFMDMKKTFNISTFRI